MLLRDRGEGRNARQQPGVEVCAEEQRSRPRGKEEDEWEGGWEEGAKGGEQRKSRGDCVLCVYMGLCGLADIGLGPEGGQALANFLQGNNTLRSLHLWSMPREEGERRDVREAFMCGCLSCFCCSREGCGCC